MASYTLYMPYGQYPGQYLPNHWALDYNPSLGELLGYGSYTVHTSTKAVYKMTNGVDFVIEGTGLVYKSGGAINGGTITSLKLIDHDNGGIIQTVTGLNWSGSSFYSTVNAGSAWYTAKVILSGNDLLKGTSGNDELWAFNGNDTLKGGAGADNLVGGRGKDTYDGGSNKNGVDQLSFDDADNDSVGASGVTVDMAKGTAIDPWGNAETFINIERIKGTKFVDKLYGSSGDDQFRPLAGKDIVDGRGGIDTIRYDRDFQHGGTKGVSVDLAAGTAVDGYGDRDTIRNIENATGSDYNDTLKGSNAANTLKGLGGNDKIYGGLGSDYLEGGNGKDLFVFDTKLSSGNVDTIGDFVVSDDTIWLDDDIFTKIGKVGDLASAAFYIGSKAHDSSDRIIYNKTTGALFYDADGNGAGAAMQFATLSKGLALTAGDFDIIA